MSSPVTGSATPALRIRFIGEPAIGRVCGGRSVPRQARPFARVMKGGFRPYQAQVLRIMLSIAVKAAVQGKLDRELARERGRQEAIERFRQAMERAVAARRAREKA